MTSRKLRLGTTVLGILAATGLFVAVTALPAYALPPTISGIFPSTPAPGCVATLTGTNFQLVANQGPVTSVQFGAQPAAAPVAIDADTQLEATVAAGLAASTPTTVTATNTGGPSAAFPFTTGPAGTCPGVPAFTPASGAVGTTVTITGTFTTAPSFVRFNTTLTGPTTTSPTLVTAVVPAGATTGPIRVYTTAGAASSAASFTVATAVPTITSFTPTSGPVGTSVTITGTNFTGATSVTFNNVAATFTPPVTSTQITATVPSTATTGPIRVVTPGGTAVSATNFTVTGGGAQHARTATFQLSGHLKGSGSVSVSDGFTDCIKNVPVKLQVQKSGGWKSLETLSTNSSGSFFGYLPNKSGKYRAKLGNFTLLTGATCGADASPSRTYHK